MKKLWSRTGLLIVTLSLLCSCTNTQETGQDTADSEGQGTLVLTANGEDFVREGFTSKDGWQISFDNLYANLEEVVAYQTDPAYDPEADQEIEAQEEVVLVEEPTTVNLAAGPEDADPIEVVEKEAPAGFYNALAWELAEAPEGEAQGYTLILDGTATKEGETIDFLIKLSPELAYNCGEFVGDQRKGIVKAEEKAEVETTFHFDHIFGDGEAAPDEEINQGALGFEPLAALAENGQLEVDQETLSSELSQEDYEKLQETLSSLGHVGEGHCQKMSQE